MLHLDSRICKLSNKNNKNKNYNKILTQKNLMNFNLKY
jgi:hypothetical protein